MTDADLLLFQAQAKSSPPTEEDDIARARWANVCIGQVEAHVALMRAQRPGIILAFYSRPTYLKGWTRWLLENAGIDIPAAWTLPGAAQFADIDRKDFRASVATAIAHYLEETGVDGVHLDTPFEIGAGCDPWSSVALVDEIAKACAPRLVVPNFGDAETWMGRTSQSASIAAITHWHLVEVFFDVNKHGAVELARRAAAMDVALRAGKKLLLGVLDVGGRNARLAATLMRNQPGKIFWGYKSTVDDFILNPELQR